MDLTLAKARAWDADKARVPQTHSLDDDGYSGAESP